MKVKDLDLKVKQNSTETSDPAAGGLSQKVIDDIVMEESPDCPALQADSMLGAHVDDLVCSIPPAARAWAHDPSGAVGSEHRYPSCLHLL